jgi:hypothetical protein
LKHVLLRIAGFASIATSNRPCAELRKVSSATKPEQLEGMPFGRLVNAK